MALIKHKRAGVTLLAGVSTSHAWETGSCYPGYGYQGSDRFQRACLQLLAAGVEPRQSWPQDPLDSVMVTLGLWCGTALSSHMIIPPDPVHPGQGEAGGEV